jgi:hypothetical protein
VKTRQNKWNIKNGSAMARRSSTTEHRPNKERDGLTSAEVVTLGEKSVNVPLTKALNPTAPGSPCGCILSMPLCRSVLAQPYIYVYILIPFLHLDLCVLGSCCEIVRLHVRYCCTVGTRSTSILLHSQYQLITLCM